MPVGRHRCFKELVQFHLDTMQLTTRSPLGRLSDLGSLNGFDELCRNANILICPHRSLVVFAGRFRRGIKEGVYYGCPYCAALYCLSINSSNQMIELHISRQIGSRKATGRCSLWSKASYPGTCINPAFRDHPRAFADWLERTHNPKTGAVHNGGKSEMFVPAQRQR
jgi:hypothetical protein